MKYIKVLRYELNKKTYRDSNLTTKKYDLLGFYIQPFDQIENAISGEFDSPDDEEVGDKIELEIIEMTEEQYEALPEFKGY